MVEHLDVLGLTLPGGPAASGLSVQRGASAGEFQPDTDAALSVHAIFGPADCRLLLGLAPVTEDYGDQLIDQVLRRVSVTRGRPQG